MYIEDNMGGTIIQGVQWSVKYGRHNSPKTLFSRMKHCTTLLCYRIRFSMSPHSCIPPLIAHIPPSSSLLYHDFLQESGTLVVLMGPLNHQEPMLAFCGMDRFNNSIASFTCTSRILNSEIASSKTAISASNICSSVIPPLPPICCGNLRLQHASACK